MSEQAPDTRGNESILGGWFKKVLYAGAIIVSGAAVAVGYAEHQESPFRGLTAADVVFAVGMLGLIASFHDKDKILGEGK